MSNAIHPVICPIGGDVNALTISESMINIFPNPNNGTFTLEVFNVENEDVYVNIYNIHGQKVSSYTFSNVSGELSKEFDISEYGTGVYQFEIITNNKVINRKVVVE